MTPKALAYIQAHPEFFIQHTLGCETLEQYQKTVCRAVAEYDRVAVYSCHALGKTFLVARIALAFLYSHPRSIVITTAPTHRQVEFLLWGEIHKATRASKYALGGHLTNTKLEIEKGEWYAVGFSPEKPAGSSTTGQEGSNFQGFHAGNAIMIIFDEATGIPIDIWTQVEGLLTSGFKVKFVCIGNPTTTACEFYKCTKSSLWHNIKLSCFDSPNLIANGITSIEELEDEVSKVLSMPLEKRRDYIAQYKKPVPYLLSAQFVVEKALPSEWGIKHPLFITKILGEFDESSSQTLITGSDVEAAQKRNVTVQASDLRYIALDVARYGDDVNVWTELIGFKQTRKQTKAKQDTMQTVGDSIEFLRQGDDNRKTYFLVDATGIGSGVYDRLVELKKEMQELNNVEFIEINYGYGADTFEVNPEQKDRHKKAYANLKARMFALLARDIKNSLQVQNDAAYNFELSEIKYEFTSRGQLSIESKDDYKKRTGKGSPDSADSLMMANFGRYISGLVGHWVDVENEILDELDEIGACNTIAGALHSNQW